MNCCRKIHGIYQHESRSFVMQKVFLLGKKVIQKEKKKAIITTNTDLRVHVRL